MTSPGDKDDRYVASNDKDDLKSRLNEIDQRIKSATVRDTQGISEQEKRRRGSAIGKALRLSTELVVGVFGGGFIGWLLDRWLGTLPVFLIIFLLFGIAAGLLNAIRTARQMGQEHTGETKDR